MLDEQRIRFIAERRLAEMGLSAQLAEPELLLVDAPLAVHYRTEIAGNDAQLSFLATRGTAEERADTERRLDEAVRQAQLSGWRVGVLRHFMPDDLVVAYLASKGTAESVLLRTIDQFFDPTVTQLVTAAAALE